MNIGGKEVKGISVGGLKASGCWMGGTKAWPAEQPAPVIEDWVCFEALSANTSVSMYGQRQIGYTQPPHLDLEYSLDGSSWSTFTVDSTTVSLPNPGDKVYLRATGYNNRTSVGYKSSNMFRGAGKYKVSGKIAYLLRPDGEEPDGAWMANTTRELFMNCTALVDASGLEMITKMSSQSYHNECAAMFQGCTSLTAAPATLPATTLADSCYLNMFNGCSALTAAPALPATTLADSCYSQMFKGCTSLTAAPALSATTLASSCYSFMFDGCTSLTQAPSLPATTLADSCYSNMFRDCTSLTAAPVLSATTLADSCYSAMFQGCTSLTHAPALPVTTLANYCYNNMFKGCTSLNTAPVLPATTLAQRCYREMFNGCSALSSVETGLTAWGDSLSATQDWLSGVAATGEFRCPTALPDTRGVSNIPVGWTKVDPSVDTEPLTFEFLDGDGGMLDLQWDSQSPTPANPSLEWSEDGETWRAFSDAGAYTDGPKLYLRAASENQTWSPANGSGAWCLAPASNSGGGYKVYGNVQTLLKADGSRTDAPSYCFFKLFNDPGSGENLELADASGLRLPATTLSAHCYHSMFSDCTSLTAAPSALPATTLASYCYHSMFSGCTSLATAPALPATTLATYCYQYMFNDCRELSAAPALPATTLANYCYAGMFTLCNSLYRIEVGFDAWPTGRQNSTQNWTIGLPESDGEFHCPAALPDVRGDSNIPNGWTKVDLA